MIVIAKISIPTEDTEILQLLVQMRKLLVVNL